MKSKNTMKGTMMRKKNVYRYSNCCGALPIGELAYYKDTDGDNYSGRCSECKEGAVFFTEEELAAEDGYDEGMGMGGDKYNDVMFDPDNEFELE